MSQKVKKLSAVSKLKPKAKYTISAEIVIKIIWKGKSAKDFPKK